MVRAAGGWGLAMALKYLSSGSNWETGVWKILTNGSITTTPTVGDTVYILPRPITAVGGDLTGVQVLFSDNGTIGATGTLTLTAGAIAASAFIGTVFNNSPGTVEITGTVSSAGTLEAEIGIPLGGVGAPLTLAVESGGQFTSSGTMIATNAGTLHLIGTVTNDGLLTAAQQTGPSSFTPGTIIDDGLLINAGSITEVFDGAITFNDGLTNAVAGAITDNGGALTIDGGLANNGQVTLTAGAMTIAGGVTGSGTISIGTGETLAISGSVAATQTVAFTDGVGLLQLTAAQGFAGTVTGLVGHDIIDLVGLTATHTTYDSTSGLVGVYDGGNLLLSFTAPGLAGPLNVAPDGNGGTALTQELAGTEASVTTVMIDGASGTNAHDWGIDNPTVTYSFDPGSDWTTAEQAAFVDGLGLYAAVADITFVQAAPGLTGQILFERGAPGSGATTTWTESGSIPGNLNTATISIDTSQTYWSDLSTVGSYAWMTLLHEEGHAIALSHPGNYNETADIATQQMFYTDTHQYSVMSYFDSSYSGANWVTSGTTLYAESPMLYDISAVQQVYGADATLLDGGDTFGFDASATITGDAALAVYNFSTNQPPIVTIWDAGTNNTLDLTGFAAASYVDLQAGSFSNVDGLTDNLAIAYATRIDTALGGAGNDTFVLNTDGDVIDGGGGTNTAVFAGPSAGYAVAFNGGTVTVTPLGGGAADTLTHIQTLQFADESEPACYLRGTRIRTERGEVAVEDLRAQEDWAITASGHAARVVWVGWRRVDIQRHPRPWDVMPVRIRAGAFGPDQPVRDLLLSPDHAVFVAGMLIPIRTLINGATIVQERHAAAHWFHVELDWHDVLLAEGLAAESYLDTGNRGAFANGGPAVHMHPDFALRIWQAQGCAPLVRDGAELAAVRGFLLDRAASLGHAATGDPDMRVVAAGRQLWPEVLGRVRRFRLPASARGIRLLSRSAVPAEMRPDSTDRRRLGVAVSRLVYGGEAIALTDPRLGAGWHAAEIGGAWRWTDGAAELALPGGQRVLDVEVAITERYWLDEPRAVAAA